MSSGGINTKGIFLAALGGILVYSGVSGTGPLDTFKTILSGKKPAALSHTPGIDPGAVAGASKGVGAALGGSGLGNKIANDSLTYLGIPYVWGGASRAGADCSGLVHMVLSDVGINQTRMTAAGYQSWSGATTVKRPAQAGDLLCYGSPAYHIAIALSDTEMVEAPTFGIPVRRTALRATDNGLAVQVRRVNGA